MGLWRLTKRTGAVLWGAASGVICLLAAQEAGAAVIRQARGISVPIYVEGKAHPVGTIRIDRVYRDHRRLGFFKVKALPVLVAEGVRLEVREPAGATNLLEELTRALEGLAGNRCFEARNVRIVVGTGQTPGLEARRLRPPTEPAGAFGLEQVRLQDAGRQLLLARATARMVRPGVLRLIGPDGLRLDYDLSCGYLSLNPSEPIEPLGQSP